MNCKVFLKASPLSSFVKKKMFNSNGTYVSIQSKKVNSVNDIPLKVLSYKNNRCLKLKANLVSFEAQEQFQKNKVITTNYSLDSFHRSNQDTCLVHKPAVFEGQWVESGDLLADCSASLGGELSLGQNILIAYMPWEGYNFEDAILISERLVYDDLYTSIHIEKYEMEIRETKLGIEQITREIPEIQEKELENLDSSGVAKLGSWVQEGDILVGKITPIHKKGQSPYQKLLYTILEKQFLPIRDSSLRAPKGIKAKVIGIQIFKNENNPTITKVKKKSNQVSKKLETLTNSKNLNEINVLSKTLETFSKKKVNYFLKVKPLNTTFLNSLESKTLYSKLRDSSLKKSKLFFNSKGLLLENKIKQSNYNFKKVNYGTVSFIKNSFIYAMNKVKPSKDNLEIGLTTPQLHKGYRNQTQTNLAKIYFIKKLQGYALARSKKIFKKHNNLNFSFPSEVRKESKKEGGKANTPPLLGEFTSFAKQRIQRKEKIGAKRGGRNKKNILSRELYFKKALKKKALNNVSLSSIHIFLAEKRKVQVGDKMAGRHGNKGIISQILPREDMPYLPDGTPLDMILNPLGVPSRMNVGQIYECLLGFAGKYLGENYKVFPFDEIYGPEASRSFVYSKLYEARVKTGFDWLYNPNNPGKIRLYDGRTGESFDQAITVGDSYILRLVHMVDDKIHCLTSDHDVLTSDGWLPIANVKLDHQVATLTKNGELIYQKPNEVLHFHNYAGELYHIKNTNLDLTVTLNHRMYVKKGNLHGQSFDGYELKTVETIKGKHYQYLKNANWLKQDYQFILAAIVSNSRVIDEKQLDMDAWLEFFGLWIAEDWSTSNQKDVLFENQDSTLNSNLSNPEKKILTKAVNQVQVLFPLLYEAKEKLRIHDEQLWSYLKPLSLEAPNKALPSWVWQLSQRQAKKLLEAMCFGFILPPFTFSEKEEEANKSSFGGIDKAKSDSSLNYYTSSGRLADDVMRLALHAGWSGNKHLHILNGSVSLIELAFIPSGKSQLSSNYDIWRISIIKGQNNPSVNYTQDQNAQVEEVFPFEGSVYCLSIPNEVFYVRRNGLPVWTGNSRSTGPYSLVTQQPLRGRSKQGGQRLGEMEVWALEGYGAAFTLLEMLTIKSDDMTGRMTLWSNLILNKDISIGTPESFKVLVCELQALCLDIGLFRSNPGNKVSLNEIDSLMNLP